MRFANYSDVSAWGRNANCHGPYHTYDFYFGTDKAKVASLDSSTLVAPSCTRTADPSDSNVIQTDCTLSGGADYNTTYYWRVKACNGPNNCTASGNDASDAGNDGVWQFTTGPLPAWWQSKPIAP
jgi:hypothetical protein